MTKEELFIFLNTPKPLTEEEQNLRNWVKECGPILKGRTSFEVAAMAVACGFNPDLAYSFFANFTDAMSGSCIDNRAAMHVFSVHQAINRVNKMKEELERIPELDLMPLWKELHFNQTGDCGGRP